MLRFQRVMLIAGMAAAVGMTPGLCLAQQSGDDQSAVQQAIQFEKAKQAAADRQAQIDEGRTAVNTADRAETPAQPKPKPKRAKPNAHKTPPAQK